MGQVSTCFSMNLYDCVIYNYVYLSGSIKHQTQTLVFTHLICTSNYNCSFLYFQKMKHCMSSCHTGLYSEMGYMCILGDLTPKLHTSLSRIYSRVTHRGWSLTLDLRIIIFGQYQLEEGAVLCPLPLSISLKHHMSFQNLL